MSKFIHGVHNPAHKDLGHYEQFAGKRTAVLTQFANVFDDSINPHTYVRGGIGSQWEWQHVALLTLEPWGGDDINHEIAAGKHNDRLTQWTGAIQSFLRAYDDSKIYIRIAHEMNGNWYPWGGGDPGKYIEMYRHIHNGIRSRDDVNGTNTQFMWAPNCDDVGKHPPAERYYPGDAFVDWVGVDGYNFGNDGGGWRSPSLIFSGMIDRLRKRSGNKPVAIPETGSSSRGGDKQAWIHSLFDFAENSPVRMLNYFDLDKEGDGESDWAVFAGRNGASKQTIGSRTYRTYPAYHQEITKSRVITTNGPGRLTNAEFHGNF